MKFTDEDIEQIYVELREGSTNASIAKDFGCSTAFIREINTGKYYPRPNYDYPIKKSVKKEKKVHSEEPVPFRVLAP